MNYSISQQIEKRKKDFLLSLGYWENRDGTWEHKNSARHMSLEEAYRFESEF